MNYIKLVGFFVLLSHLGCTNSNKTSDPFADCKAGKPEAIFAGDFSQVTKQHFEIKNKEGIEKVQFENGLSLELINQGCDLVTQLFQFEVPGQHPDSTNWMNLAASQFTYLSRTSDAHASLGMWSQALEQMGPSMHLGEKMMLQPGFHIKVDKVQGGDNTTLLVELSQE